MSTTKSIKVAAPTEMTKTGTPDLGVAVRNGGRPSAFASEMMRQARFLCERGCTDVELAEFFGVCEKTLNNWKKAHPEFLQSLKEGKAVADSRVQRSLFKRATGYSHPDVHFSNFQGTITATPLTKHYPPDTTAAIFWLKNRRPDQWRDKVDLNTNHTGTIEIVIGGDSD
jgi:hypothetical protein